jgi:hypothetical protein
MGFLQRTPALDEDQGCNCRILVRLPIIAVGRSQMEAADAPEKHHLQAHAAQAEDGEDGVVEKSAGIHDQLLRWKGFVPDQGARDRPEGAIVQNQQVTLMPPR